MNNECTFTTDVPLDKDGYPRAKYSSRMWRLNRLIYKFVYGGLQDGDVVGHSCNNKGCINPNHLYKTTASENSTHAARDGLYKTKDEHPKAKITSEIADEIRDVYSYGSCSQKFLADKFGISQSVVSSIIRKEIWK